MSHSVANACTNSSNASSVSPFPVSATSKASRGKLDGRGNYTLGITEQIIFPEINIDNINKLMGMNITFVTSANTDEEGYALLREFGLPFKKAN